MIPCPKTTKALNNKVFYFVKNFDINAESLTLQALSIWI